MFPRVLLPESKRIDFSRRRFAQGAVFIKNDYAALPSVDQRRVETTLANFRRRRQNSMLLMFARTVKALIGHDGNAINTAVQYRPHPNTWRPFAVIWLGHGSRPGRAMDSLLTPRVGFHRFVDLCR